MQPILGGAPVPKLSATGGESALLVANGAENAEMRITSCRRGLPEATNVRCSQNAVRMIS